MRGKRCAGCKGFKGWVLKSQRSLGLRYEVGWSALLVTPTAMDGTCDGATAGRS